MIGDEKVGAGAIRLQIEQLLFDQVFTLSDFVVAEAASQPFDDQAVADAAPCQTKDSVKKAG
ncbi:MAG: hypothetical protein QME60_05370 [Verrucomicrobiota bacterium]|nr:hypothetical protein [Verrucomicrobiota bacterium]